MYSVTIEIVIFQFLYRGLRTKYFDFILRTSYRIIVAIFFVSKKVGGESGKTPLLLSSITKVPIMSTRYGVLRISSHRV